MSDSLREQGKDGPANAASKLAQYAEKVGGYLREKDPDALLADAEDFGRRQPWVVAAGGLALGLAASRLLKASSSRRYSERISQVRLQQPAPAPTYPPPAVVAEPSEPPTVRTSPRRTPVDPDLEV